jgi:multidrug efflux pump subunit AcrA (membrane-fusion protein)
MRALALRIASEWRRVAVAAIVLAVVAAIYFTGLGRTRASVPTAAVSRGEFIDVVELRSEIRPVKSVVLSAPTQAGELQIVRLVKNGAKVNAGDVVVEFDDTALKRQETDRKAELKQRDAELEQWRAQARMADEASATNLLKAQFDVNRAKLDVVDRDFVARIDLEFARLALSDAQQRLLEAEKKQLSDKAAQESEGARRTRRRDRTQQELERTQGVIAGLRVRAPSAGTASLMPNPRFGRMMGGGMQDFREGDRAWPGASILELPDLSSVHLTARLDEADRGRVEMGQPATVHLDAVPDKVYDSKVSKISLLARVDFSTSWPPTRDFDLQLDMNDPDARLKPGMSATVRVAVATLPNVLVVPAQAVSLVNGRPTVYVQTSRGFDSRPVVIMKRGREQVALSSGVEAGERLALGNPNAKPAGGR